MLEEGDSLHTWQLLRDPADAASFPIPAVRIGDHRKAYLEYEGRVGGDRGDVRRIDRGPLHILEFTGDQCRFRADGRCLAGEYALRGSADAWALWRVGENPA